MSEELFFLATAEEIKKGKTTDVYFLRTEEVLRKESLNYNVFIEVTASEIKGSEWGVFAGVEDVIELLLGLNIDVYTMPEGTIFRREDEKGIKVPTMVIVGEYLSFSKFETPILGFICSKSGMTTRAARIRLAAKSKSLLSFGARRAHPAITPVVSYCAHIGGCDGISCILGAEKLGINPSGTIPHALIILFQDQVKAWKAFDKHVSPDIPRIALVDTYFDEKTEAILASESVPTLSGVRLDTPSSRKGNFKQIIREVRWELDERGYSDVKIYVSGGLGEKEVLELVEEVDGFGIGSAISAAPPIDFAMDIVSINGENGEWLPVAKRGKFSGRKMVFRCPKCLYSRIFRWEEDGKICPECQTMMIPLLKKYIEAGKRIQEKPTVNETREYIKSQLKQIRNQ